MAGESACDHPDVFSGHSHLHIEFPIAAGTAGGGVGLLGHDLNPDVKAPRLHQRPTHAPAVVAGLIARPHAAVRLVAAKGAVGGSEFVLDEGQVLACHGEAHADDAVAVVAADAVVEGDGAKEGVGGAINTAENVGRALALPAGASLSTSGGRPDGGPAATASGGVAVGCGAAAWPQAANVVTSTISTNNPTAMRPILLIV